MSISYIKYERIVWAARIMAIVAPILAVAYSLLIGFWATIKPFSVPVGVFQGGSIILFPFLLAIGFIGWKWALLGGILVLIIGLSLLFPILTASGWPYWYKIPYLTFWTIFIASGVLYLTSFYSGKSQR
jgi:hypothetical protein